MAKQKLTELHMPRNTDNITKTMEWEGYTITYRLSETEGEGKYKTIYSVSVSIRKDSYFDEKTAFDITRIRQKALWIFNMLWKNTVTPCTLIEVLEELL